LAACWLREPDRPAAPTRAHSAPGPLRDARVWRTALAIGLLCCPQFAVLTFATVFLHDFSGAGIGATTAVLVAVQLGAMIARVASGRWTDRRGNRGAYLRFCIGLSFLLFAALGATAWATSDAMLALAILMAAAGICVSAWHGVAYTELATLAGAGRAGTALGMANSCCYLGLFLTPAVMPHLVAACRCCRAALQQEASAAADQASARARLPIAPSKSSARSAAWGPPSMSPRTCKGRSSSISSSAAINSGSASLYLRNTLTMDMDACTMSSAIALAPTLCRTKLTQCVPASMAASIRISQSSSVSLASEASMRRALSR
jgi:hypothetical protein